MIYDLNKKLDKAIEYLNNHSGRKVNIKIMREKRSLSQNAYFHGVICSIFGLEFGWTVPEAKQIFVDSFPEMFEYEKNGKQFKRGTSDLNTKEFEDFNSKCRMLASHESCYIPEPNETTDEMYNLIESQSKWL